MRYERIQVKCGSRDLVNDRPVSLVYGGKEHLVEEIVDRWYEGGQGSGRPGMYYFKVRTSVSREFILRYNTLFDAWAVLVDVQQDG